MNKKILILKTSLDICDRHTARIKLALANINSLMPLTLATFDNLSNAELDQLDVLTGRFTKLQDHIGQKLFPELLEVLEEDLNNKSFIDILNLLEKLNLIPSVDFWVALRKVRNSLAHEYPENPNVLILALNNVFQKSVELIKYYENLKVFISNLK